MIPESTDGLPAKGTRRSAPAAGRTCVICGNRRGTAAAPGTPTCGSPRCLHAYSLQQALSPGSRACASCGRALPPSGAGNLCDSDECRRAWSLRQPEERRREAQAGFEARLKRYETSLRRRLGPRLPADAPCVLLDFFDPRVSPLPRSRRLFHEAHLFSLVEQEGNRPDKPDPAPSALDPERHLRSLEPSLAPVSAAACAACGGYCCRRGGDQAFINREVLRRYRESHPGASPEDFVRDYLDRVPSRTCEGSCVYHTSGGCALPPEMQSSVCRQYYCEKLRAIHALCRRSSPDLAMLAVRVDGFEIRSGVILSGKGHEIVEIDPSFPAG